MEMNSSRGDLTDAPAKTKSTIDHKIEEVVVHPGILSFGLAIAKKQLSEICQKGKM